jgi:hypothetical protein
LRGRKGALRRRRQWQATGVRPCVRDEADQFYRRNGGWGRQVSFNPSPRRDLQRERGGGGCGARGSRRGVDNGLARDSLWLRRVEQGSVGWDRRQGARGPPLRACHAAHLPSMSGPQGHPLAARAGAGQHVCWCCWHTGVLRTPVNRRLTAICSKTLNYAKKH